MGLDSGTDGGVQQCTLHDAWALLASMHLMLEALIGHSALTFAWGDILMASGAALPSDGFCHSWQP